MRPWPRISKPSATRKMGNALGDDQCVAARDPHHAERRHEGRNPHVADRDAVRRAEEGADHDPGDHAGGKAVARIHDHGGGHRGGGEDRAHGKVDPLGEDDESLPHRDQRDDGRLDGDLEQVSDREEVGRELRQDQPQQQQDACGEDGGVVDDRALCRAKNTPGGRFRVQAQEAGRQVLTSQCVPPRNVPGVTLGKTAERRNLAAVDAARCAAIPRRLPRPPASFVMPGLVPGISLPKSVES